MAICLSCGLLVMSPLVFTGQGTDSHRTNSKEEFRPGVAVCTVGQGLASSACGARQLLDSFLALLCAIHTGLLETALPPPILRLYTLLTLCTLADCTLGLGLHTSLWGYRYSAASPELGDALAFCC